MAYICVKDGVTRVPTVQIDGVTVPASAVYYDASSGHALVSVADSSARITFDGAVGEYFLLMGPAPSAVIEVSTQKTEQKGLFGAPVVQVAGQPVDIGSAVAGLLFSKVL